MITLHFVGNEEKRHFHIRDSQVMAHLFFGRTLNLLSHSALMTEISFWSCIDFALMTEISFSFFFNSAVFVMP